MLKTMSITTATGITDDISGNEIIVVRTELMKDKHGDVPFAYSAWVPSAYAGIHTTLMTIDGKCYGKVSTERLPADIEAMVGGTARYDAVKKWHASRRDVAYQAIETACPEARNGRPDGYGEIEVVAGR